MQMPAVRHAPPALTPEVVSQSAPARTPVRDRLRRIRALALRAEAYRIRLGKVDAHPLGALVLLLLAVPALAYPGEQLLNFAAQYIIAPLGLFAVIIVLAASFFRPDLVKGAIYACILCAVLFFVIKMSAQITSAFQAA